MATLEAIELWKHIAERQAKVGAPIDLSVRFSADADGENSAALRVVDGKPVLRLGDAALSLFREIDPDVVAQRFIDKTAGHAWRDEFMRLRGSRELTPNQACRLLFGPYYRPDRTTYAFNANVEFAVDPKNLGLVFDDFDGTNTHWPSLSDLMQRFDTSDAEQDRFGGQSTSKSSSNLTRAMPAFGGLLDAFQNAEVRAFAVHNFDLWRLMQGGLALTRANAVRFESRGDYWRLPERRLLVAYFGERFHRRYVPVHALRVLAARTFAHFDTARRAGRFGAAINADSQPGKWPEICNQVAEVGRGLAFSEYDELKAVWGQRLPERSLADDFAEFMVQAAKAGHAGPLEKPFWHRLPWFPYMGLDSLDTLPWRQRFFFGFYLLFASTNAYKTGGSQNFAPILQNNRMDELLAYADKWADGVRPTQTRFEVFGKSGEKKRDCSHHAPVVELFGFLNLHRQPFHNSMTEDAYSSYAPDEHDLFRRLERVGEGGRAFLAQRPSAVKELLAIVEALQETPVDAAIGIEMEGIHPKAVAAAHPHDAASQIDIALRANVKTTAKDRLAAFSESERAQLMLHLLLDASIYVGADAGVETKLREHVAPESSVAGIPVAVASPKASAAVVHTAPSAIAVGSAALRLPAALRGTGIDALHYLRAGYHVLLAGCPGTGKTTLAQFIGHAWNSEATDVRDELTWRDAPTTTVANSSWSPFHTIGGLVPNGTGGLVARGGIFVLDGSDGEWQLRPECLVLDEMNRADLDRCIGELYPLLSGSVDSVRPAGIPGVQRIRSNDRFRIVATVNDATIDDIVFPISAGLARRFIRFELPGATEDELKPFVSPVGASNERRDAALSALERFFEVCEEKKVLIEKEAGRRLPFGVGYFAPLRSWVEGRLLVRAELGVGDPEEQAMIILRRSLASVKGVRALDAVFTALVEDE